MAAETQSTGAAGRDGSDRAVVLIHGDLANPALADVAHGLAEGVSIRSDSPLRGGLTLEIHPAKSSTRRRSDAAYAEATRRQDGPNRTFTSTRMWPGAVPERRSLKVG